MTFKFSMKSILLFLCVMILIVSCKKENRLETEIANINTNIKIERFDKLFAEVTSEKLSDLKTAYPFMFPEKFTDSFWLAKKTDTLQVQLFNEVDKTFLDFNPIELEIESLFNHLKYYFPEFNPPRIITTTNDVDYRNRVVVTDTISVIALDSYLGSEHKFYGSISNYLKAGFNQVQMVVDLANKYAEKYTYQSDRKTLLDEMIYSGKLLYFKDVMLPFKTEAERIGYSEAEMEWAILNESYIWRYFVSRELLFSTDTKLPRRFINPAPFSKFYLEIDAESPGKLGQYIGWQIVRAYMNQNDVSLKEMLIKSTEDIFNNSKFKPRK
ncbi:gliding motility lipoprotein GldB [uncultured Algibacter sp.]|uniref:gliding motility lipoprotein GldB n=1 Tax=uncultured Algibacter sp. TaxID=298659 RepID=UPI002609268C|nr:gliding motility lipoprotein GldB [uncultured Algibacter sp.]